MNIAAHVGLTNHPVWLETFGDVLAVVATRYDRAIEDDEITRIHQEDCAQALGLPWGGDAKFERNDNRANYRAIAALLDRDRALFDVGESDRERLLSYTTLNVAVGNTDAHAKNHALLHRADGAVRLAPIYDVAAPPFVFDGNLHLALRVSQVVYQPDVKLEDLVAEGTSWGLAVPDAERVATETLERILAAVAECPATDRIAATIPGYVATQATNLLQGKAAGAGSSASPIALMDRIAMPGRA